jgi:hypothetical protein
MSARLKPKQTFDYQRMLSRAHTTSPASALGRAALMCLILFPVVLFALFMLVSLFPS